MGLPSIGHVAVGLAGARLAGTPAGARPWAWALLLVVVSCLPDIDVLAFRFGIPYSAPFGHRGAAHSLTVATLCGAAMAFIAHGRGVSARFVGLMTGMVIASHGLLDTMTDGGLGIALLWPFTNARYFAPWRPIPVAPIGARLFSPYGIQLMVYESVLFLPVWLVAAWPGGRIRPGAEKPQG